MSRNITFENGNFFAQSTMVVFVFFVSLHALISLIHCQNTFNIRYCTVSLIMLLYLYIVDYVLYKRNVPYNALKTLKCSSHLNVLTNGIIMILSFQTDMPGQTVQTQIRGAV